MLVTEILGNVRDLGDGAVIADRVVFDNESRVKRIQRVTSESGTEIGLRLDASVKELEEGDVLAQLESGLVVATIAPVDVLVITPATVEEALRVAHALGNRHLQAQFFEGEMVVRYDHTVEHLLEHMGVAYSRGDRVMPKAFRHAEHTH